MTQLLVELDLILQEKQARLIQEKSNALLFLKIERVASILYKGGFELSVENIAKFGFLEPSEVQGAIDWMTRGAKPKALPFELGAQQPAESTLARVKAGLLWLESRHVSKRNKKPLPPSDAALVGVQRIMELTGLGRVEILECVEANQDDIIAEFPDFRMGWVNDTKEIIKKNAKNQHVETKIKLIRRAVEEISQGRLGTITGEVLSKWKNKAIGLEGRQIDKLLQTRPELRDLDKYRATGTRYRETDADREAAYQRSLRT